MLIPLPIAQRRRLDHPLLYLSPYFRQNRTLYNDLLFAVSAQSQWERWLRFFLEAVVARARAAIELSDRLIALGNQWHEALNERRAARNAHRLADYVHQHIPVSARTAEHHLDVRPPTAYSASRALEEPRILVEATGRARDRIWVAPALMRLLVNKSAPSDRGSAP